MSNSSTMPDALVDPAATLAKLTLDEKLSLLSGGDLWRTAAIQRLGVPYLKVTDGPNGARGSGDFNDSVPAALFPAPSCVGATWDTTLAREMGSGIARDSRSKQCHVSLAPTVGGMHRDPRGGRSFEGYSESPVLAGEIGAAWILGCQAQGVGATPKHFVGNEAETDRRNNSSTLSEAALREIYLAPFQRIMRDVAREGKGKSFEEDPFQGQPACIMTAYNRVNGVSASEHDRLLNGVLRQEWGFKGLVMSDWFALHAHGLKQTDLEMPGPGQERKPDVVKELISSGKVSEEDIDTRVLAVLRLLRQVSPLGFLASPSDEKETTTSDEAIKSSIRRIAAEGAVLLRNEGNLLPLSTKAPPKRIALIGAPAKEPFITGGGSAALTPAYITAPFTSIRKLLDDLPGGVGQGTELVYHEGVDIHNFPSPPSPEQLPKGSVKLEWFSNTTCSGEPVSSQQLDAPALEMWWPPRPDALPRNGGWSTRASFTLTAQTSGTHSLAFLALGGATVQIEGDEDWKFISHGDFFEFLLNPARDWKSHAIKMSAGETRKIVVEYSPPRQEAFLEAMRCGAFKLSFAEERNEDEAIAAAAELAASADVAIVCVGTGKEWESEGYDRPNILLPKRQADLVKGVRAKQAKTVLVNMTGAAVELPFLEGKDAVPAALQTWFGGQEAGNAIAEVLFGIGEAPASGRMPSTWPRKIEDHPSATSEETFPGTSQKGGYVVHYREGRLMGHAGYEARKIEPAFWFGQGMGGYASFTSSVAGTDGAVTKDGGVLDVHVKVKNTSEREGKEVVQLYIRAPTEHVKGTDRPIRSLAAFAAVRLAAGEEKQLTLRIEQEAVSHWEGGEDGHWQVRSGEWEVILARDANPASQIDSVRTAIKEDWTWSGIGHI